MFYDEPDYESNPEATKEFMYSSDKIIWPNLFLIGVPKAGSTAVYLYLHQHPQVYMTPAKEPGFFAIDGELYDLEHRHTLKNSYFLTSIEAYQTLFRYQTNEIVIGDATPHYFFHKRAALRIAHYSPDAKIVAILRSPADRMYSAYMMDVRNGAQQLTFEEIVTQVRSNQAATTHILNSYYFEHLKHYFDLFKSEQLKIVLYDDLSANGVGLMKELYQFLNVDDSFVPDTSIRPNRSGVPKSAHCK